MRCQGFMAILVNILALEKFREGFVSAAGTATPESQPLALGMLLTEVHSQSGRADNQKIWK